MLIIMTITLTKPITMKHNRSNNIIHNHYNQYDNATIPTMQILLMIMTITIITQTGILVVIITKNNNKELNKDKIKRNEIMIK